MIEKEVEHSGTESKTLFSLAPQNCSREKLANDLRLLLIFGSFQKFHMELILLSANLCRLWLKWHKLKSCCILAGNNGII